MPHAIDTSPWGHVLAATSRSVSAAVVGAPQTQAQPGSGLDGALQPDDRLRRQSAEHRPGARPQGPDSSPPVASTQKLTQELHVVSLAHGGGLGEVLAGVAREPCAHEAVEHVVHVLLAQAKRRDRARQVGVAVGWVMGSGVRRS